MQISNFVKHVDYAGLCMPHKIARTLGETRPKFLTKAFRISVHANTCIFESQKLIQTPKRSNICNIQTCIHRYIHTTVDSNRKLPSGIIIL